MRFTPQTFILFAIAALTIQWLLRSFVRLQRLRDSLEAKYLIIEKNLNDREELLPLLENWYKTAKIDDQRVNEAFKSMNFINKNIHFDYQLQQQKISNQLCLIMRYLHEHQINDTQFSDLKQKLYDLDKSIQNSSNNFNQNVKIYNKALNLSPASWIANNLGFLEAESFKLKPL